MQKLYSEKDVPLVQELLAQGVHKDSICKHFKWELWTLNRFIKSYLKDYAPPGNSRPYGLHYNVFDDGKVWTRHSHKFLVGDLDKDGYLCYRSMWQLGLEFKAHRLVLKLFDRDPLPHEVSRHLDGNPGNNNLSNLAWGTEAENQQDRIKHGRHIWVRYDVYLQKNVWRGTGA